MFDPYHNLFFIFRTEIRRNRGIAGILLLLTFVTVLALLFFYSSEWSRLAAHGGDPFHISRRWAIHFTFTEASILMLLSPFLGAAGIVRIWEDKNSTLFFLAPGAYVFYLVRWLFSISLLLIILLISSGVYLYFMKMGLPLTQVVSSRIVLISIVCALTSLGFCTGILLREMTISLLVSYLIVSILMGQVLFLGPFLDRLSQPSETGGLIHLLMVTNGYAGIASSFELDVMRMGWLYEISPVGMYRFVYPAWYITSFFYAAMTFLFIGIGFVGRKKILT